ncbi:MAG: LssY C-terminal domain-containing protein [Acidobacteriota bacterium]
MLRRPFRSNLFRWPRRLWLRISFWILVLALVWKTGDFTLNLLLPYRPQPVAEVPFLEHAKTQTSEEVRVTVAALGPHESYQVFGGKLALEGIQPVWIEVVNGEEVPLWYLRAGTDHAWYSPYEAYWLNRFRAPRKANKQMEQRFYDLHFQNPVMPGKTRSGFVFTRIDEGTKSIDIDLAGLNTLRSFNFQLQVPGFTSDFRKDILSAREGQPLVLVDSEDELRAALDKLPSHTTDQHGENPGDPLNLVLVGHPQDIFPAFSRRGWHGTEQTHRSSVLRTIRSFIFRRAYRYSPVSPLYVFGRSQDLSAQKSRDNVNLRNHLRLWLTQIRFGDKPIWIGQISRDIGVRFIWSIPPTTHKIDPDTDEARDGLVQDLAYSQALVKFAYIKGVGPATRSAPRYNLTGDPFFTDGLRIVLFFDRRPTTLADIEMLDWERTAAMPQSESLFRHKTPKGSPEEEADP